MSNDNNNNKAVSAVSIISLVEFLEAYPVNLTVSGNYLLVSNRDIDFSIEIVGEKIYINEASATEEDLFQLIAPGDESVLNDWLLHASMFEAVESDTRAEEEMPHFSANESESE